MKKIFASAVCLLTLTGSVSHAQLNRHVRIVNRSSSYIEAFYASNIDSRTWEENILRSGELAPGYYINVNIDDGSDHCRYDLKAVLQDGREAVTRNFDVCANESWTVYDRL